MRSYSFQKHFKHDFFRRPNWERVKLLAKLPLHHLGRIKKGLVERWYARKSREK